MLCGKPAEIPDWLLGRSTFELLCWYCEEIILAPYIQANASKEKHMSIKCEVSVTYTRGPIVIIVKKGQLWLLYV